MRMSGWSSSSRRGYSSSPHRYVSPVRTSKLSNPDQLDDVTFGAPLEYPDGANPPQMVTKTGSGRMSPVRARTMKDYEQQIGELKKENFGLKLRIYFLEERVQAKFNGDGEELFKTNIELKVEVESLKKELIDKQELLKKASNALESISTQHQTDLQQAREHVQAEATVQSTRQNEKVQALIDNLQAQMQEKQLEFAQCQKQLEDANRRVTEFREINECLDTAYKQLELKKRQLETPHSALPVGRYTSRPDGGDQDEMDGGASNGRNMLAEELEDKQRVIDQLRNALKTKELVLEQTEEEKKDIAKETRLPLENKVKQLERQLEVKDREVQTLVQKLSQALDGAKPGEIINTLILSENLQERLQKTRDSFNVQQNEKFEDYRHRLDEYEIASEQLTVDLLAKDDMIGKLEDLIREKDSEKRELERKTKEMERTTKVHEENALKRDKAIQGLTTALLQKDKEFQETGRLVEQKTEELNKAKDAIHQANLQKYQDLEEQQHALSTREEKIAEFESALRERQLENERLKKNIDRKQGEIARLTEQLEKSDDVLRQRENSMQSLREVIQEERQKVGAKAETLDQHYQSLLDDVQRKLESKEAAYQRVHRAAQDKDRQIQEYMDLLTAQQPQNESREGLINNLKQQILDKDSEIEHILEEKFTGLEEKDSELRQLKMALKERDQDIERANQMLLATEQTIDTLDKETQEKDSTLQELGAALKSQQRELQTSKDDHNKVLREKEVEIQKLRKTVAQSEKALDVCKRSPSRETHQLLNSLPSAGAAQPTHTEDLLALQEALKAERDVYYSLNQMARLQPGDQKEALEVELEAIAALRKHLENCVNKGKPSLLRGQKGPDLEQKLKELESELHASQRANSQLKSQLAAANQPTSHDRGGGASSGHASSKAPPPPHHHHNSTTSDSMHLSNSYLPSFAHLPDADGIVPDEDSLRVMSARDLQEVIRNLRSELARSHSVNSELRHQLETVSQGREDIPGQNDEDNGGDARKAGSLANGSSRETLLKHAAQTENVVKQLQECDGERNKLQRRLNMIMYGPTSDKDIRIIPVLREQLHDLKQNVAQKERDIETLRASRNGFDNRNGVNDVDESETREELEQFRDQVHRLENINMLLKRQIELNSGSGGPESGGFNPELICQMAQEIERLKTELQKTRKAEGEESNGVIDGRTRHESNSSGNGSVKNGKSGIPVLKNREGHSKPPPVHDTQSVLQKQIECMRSDISDTQIENQNLQNKLASTEATVRSMSEKLRGYRSQLEDHGIQPVRTPSPSRRNSESNLRMRNRSPSPQLIGGRGRRLFGCDSAISTERGSPTGEEFSPDTWYTGGNSISMGVDSSYFNSFGQTTNTRELKTQISELKQLLIKSRSEVDDLKVKLESAQIKLSKVGKVNPGDNAPDEAEYRRMAGINSSPPPEMTPFSKTKAVNQEVFHKLTNEVEHLKKQLRETEEMNSTLRSQLDNSSLDVESTKDMEEMLQTLQCDNSQLRQQLAESQSLCQNLRIRLQDLSDFLEEFFQEDDRGQVDLGRITPASIAELKEKLNDTQNMTSNLSVSLRDPEHSLLSTQRSIEVRQIGVSDPGLDNSGPVQVDIELKYNEAREQIQQLELQLGRRGGDKLPNLEELNNLKTENTSLKGKINELNRILAERDIVAKSLEDEKALGKERNNNLQQEINRLRQEWLSLKEGLSSEQQNVVRYIDQIDAQQRELEKYKKEACDVKEILIEEQEKFRFCDHEKKVLAKEVEKARTDSGRTNFDKTALEERNIALQEELARLKEDCSQMTVEQSKYRALLEELKAECERQRDGIMSRDDLNVQLKELLRDNQEAAEKLREDLERLNGELHDKNTNITKLKSKLSRVQRKYQIPSTDLNSEAGDFDHILPEPSKRSRTGSEVESVSASFNNGNGNSHKSEFHTTLGEKPDDASPPLSRTSPSRIRSPSPAAYHRQSSERQSPYGRLNSRESSPHRSPYSNDDESTFVADRSKKEEDYQKELYVLQGQLRASRDLNDALKKELSLYDSLNRSSISGHNSPKVGSFSTQFGGSSGELSLKEHLEEIRALRLRLEESIHQNNKLRELLQNQLAKMGMDNDTVQEYLSGSRPRSVSFEGVSEGTAQVQHNLTEMTKELELVHQEVQAKNREIEILTRELQEVRRAMLKKDQIFLELEERVKTKDQTLQMLTMDSETKSGQLRTAKQELKRLKDQINVTKADAEEQSELNKTLRLELSVYDQMNRNDTSTTGPATEEIMGGIDLNLLLQEIRQLRIQLEKSIENNNLLRQKLEERLDLGSATHSPALSLTYYEKERNPSQNGGTHDLDKLSGSLSRLEQKRGKTRNRNGHSVHFHDNPTYSPPLSPSPKYNGTGGGPGTGTLDSGLGSVGRNDPLYGLLGETYLDRYFARKGMSGSGSNTNSGPARTRSAGRSPAGSRSRTPVPSSPPTKLDRSLSADREKYTSPKGSRPSSRGPVGEDLSHRSELTNGHSLMSSPESPREGYSMENPLLSTLGSSYRVTSPDMFKVNGFVPGSSDGAMRYSIFDPARPPKHSSSSVENDIEYLQEGSTAVRVGSDLRQLYAIGELDDYELLKKEIGESHTILNGMEVRIRDRMRSYSQRSQGERIKSKEYQILREIISSVHQCKTLNSEASRLIALFWLSQLPLRDEHGNFIDVKMLKQNQGLQDELLKYKRECSRLKIQLRDTNSHIEFTSRTRDGMEQELFRQLNGHHSTLRKTNTNLEQFANGAPLSYR